MSGINPYANWKQIKKVLIWTSKICKILYNKCMVWIWVHKQIMWIYYLCILDKQFWQSITNVKSVRICLNFKENMIQRCFFLYFSFADNESFLEIGLKVLPFLVNSLVICTATSALSSFHLLEMPPDPLWGLLSLGKMKDSHFILHSQLIIVAAIFSQYELFQIQTFMRLSSF